MRSEKSKRPTGQQQQSPSTSPGAKRGECGVLHLEDLVGEAVPVVLATRVETLARLRWESWCLRSRLFPS